jgi:hypothetical protein
MEAQVYCIGKNLAYCDNQSWIKLELKEKRTQEEEKPCTIKYMFVKDPINCGEFENLTGEYCPTDLIHICSYHDQAIPWTQTLNIQAGCH